jgi:hypothetical protein
VEAGLLAVCRVVDVDELEWRLADESDAGREWLLRLARHHAAVLERALVAGALVPFRLGTILPGDRAVEELLRLRAGELETQLDRVDGAREWGVKAIFEPDRLEEVLTEEEPALAALRRESESAAGRAYFELGDRARNRAEELALHVHDRLTAVAREAAVNGSQEAAVALNGAYLVDRDREGELEGVLAELGSELELVGGALELTGPWPAFNFTGPTAPAEVGL